MSRELTLAGYLLIAVTVVGMEIGGLVGRRWPGLGDFIAVCCRVRFGRALLLTAWLWAGWHFFVRASWG